MRQQCNSMWQNRRIAKRSQQAASQSTLRRVAGVSGRAGLPSGVSGSSCAAATTAKASNTVVAAVATAAAAVVAAAGLPE